MRGQDVVVSWLSSFGKQVPMTRMFVVFGRPAHRLSSRTDTSVSTWLSTPPTY